MDGNWKLNRFRDLGMVVVVLWFQNLGSAWCLNEEGLALLRLRDRVVSDPFGALRNWNDDNGELDPCSWSGVECSDGKVVILNLKNLCLEGKMTPELGYLVHIKSIILRNNFFAGNIPEEIGELSELEGLDLGYNNFTGELPSKLGNSLSLSILLLDSNKHLAGLTPEILELMRHSENQVDENQLSGGAKRLSCSISLIAWKTQDAIKRRLLISVAGSPLNASRADISNSPVPSPELSPSSSPSPSPSSSTPNLTSTVHSPAKEARSSVSSKSKVLILAAIIVGTVIVVVLFIGIFLFRASKVVTVRPWATGLSGQLQKAFVTGVPKLKRSELEMACEDFSNVVGSSSIGTVYKGTLSSGVEIAVTSIQVKSADNWSKNLEAQFRKKIDRLSKLNHKNFINLLGYCEEDEPIFTRMMVFEYAPNGTLFEHLHIQESEHLDWGTRMRIAMGMAYCLDHMHQRTPPITHKTLDSSAINITEDYAAKISDFNFWNQIAASEIDFVRTDLLSTKTVDQESNVYSFGVLLFEMITGRLPYSVQNSSSSSHDWASEYLRAEQPIKEKVDLTLTSFDKDQLEEIGEIVKCCVHPNPKKRPAMREVTARLREVTGISPEGATPKLSSLWWAELELASVDAD